MLADIISYGALVGALLFTGLRLFFEKPNRAAIPFPQRTQEQPIQNVNASARPTYRRRRVP